MDQYTDAEHPYWLRCLFNNFPDLGQGIPTLHESVHCYGQLHRYSVVFS
jgi:hypothetical protein